MGQLGCAKYKISFRNSFLAQKKHKAAVLTLCLFFLFSPLPTPLVDFIQACVIVSV